jgi:hypothetical protein
MNLHKARPERPGTGDLSHQIARAIKDAHGHQERVDRQHVRAVVASCEAGAQHMRKLEHARRDCAVAIAKPLIARMLTFVFPQQAQQSTQGGIYQC